MKSLGSDKKALADDLMLGGAALSVSDLAIIEAQEIEWLFGRRNGNGLDQESVVT